MPLSSLNDELSNQLYIDLREAQVGTLYHYCDSAAFLSIIKSGELWATHARFLNDTEEFTRGEKIVANALADFAGAEGGARGEILLDLAERYGQVAPSAQHDYFVTSFSESGDALSQWRAYANDGAGFAIGFRGLPIVERHWPATWHRPLGHQLVKCIYDEEAFKRLISARLNGLLEKARQMFSSDDDGAWLSHFPNAVLHVLHTLVPLFKGPHFHEEREWRLITTIDRGKVNPDFRSSPASLVPYIKLQGHVGGKLDLAALIVGPHQEPKRGETAAKLCLRINGYDDSIVSVSKIPYFRSK